MMIRYINKKRAFILLMSIGLCLASFFLGLFFERAQLRIPKESASQLRVVDRERIYIRPLLACQEYENVSYGELRPVQKKIEKLFNDAKMSHRVERASLYFRDLITAHWIGLSEGDTFSPASLLKVPIMIAYLKQSEADPQLLTHQFLYKKNPKNINALISDPMLKDGYTYTAKDLIEGMIIDSDNDAKDMLVQAVDHNVLKQTYIDLGITSPYGGDSVSEDEYQISAKTYALFFRVLYNATLLSRDMSEYALEVLSKTKFSKGLRAGIAQDIPISHKYGVRVLNNTDGKRTVELSDCGVVYQKVRPYLLCVMTEGEDPQVLSSFIADTARTIDTSIRNE